MLNFLACVVLDFAIQTGAFLWVFFCLFVFFWLDLFVLRQGLSMYTTRLSWDLSCWP